MSDSDFLYSAKSNAFVLKDSPLLETANFNDAVQVSEDVFIEFYQTVREGKVRMAGEDGLPAWADAPSITKDEIKASQVIEASQNKSLILSSAKDTISGWQTDLLLGIISDEDKQRLILWREYIKKVEAINPEDAPKIKWPELPTTE